MVSSSIWASTIIWSNHTVDFYARIARWQYQLRKICRYTQYNHCVFNMSNSLHNEIHRITDTEEHARVFLFQRGFLKSSISCPGCSSIMNLVSCSSKKSSDLLIWRCSPCSRFGNIRTDISVLSWQKLTLSLFLHLVFFLSIKSLANVAISQLLGVSENTFSDWKTLIHTRLAEFLVSNPSPLGWSGVVLEMDEAKFGKRK